MNKKDITKQDISIKDKALLKKKIKTTCKICGEINSTEIIENDFFLRTDSSDKKLIDYKNLICDNCGVIYHQPNIKKKN